MVSFHKTRTVALLAIPLAMWALPAYAHVGIEHTSSFAAGFAHPFSGLDHMMAMIAVGLWAAIKGGKALWVWPLTFVAVMLVGGILGMLHVPVPFVEPGILASVVALGLLVALAVDLPLSYGIGIVGVFAILHGHAHGTEVSENVAGIQYMAGFALATGMLHGIGVSAAFLPSVRFRNLARTAGAACAAAGAALAFGVI